MLFLDASDIDAARRAMCELAVVFLIHPPEAEDESERHERRMVEDANQRISDRELSLPGTSTYHKMCERDSEQFKIRTQQVYGCGRQR